MLEDLTRDLRHSPMSELGPTTWRAAELIEQQQAEIERLRAAGDKLAAAVNDEHRPRFCEMDCPSRMAVEAWEETRRGNRE